MVAAGTSPNVIYEKEHPNTFKLDKWKQFFGSCSRSGSELIEGDGFFTSYQHPRDHRKLITFYGDNHPIYAGNVVKAMASARDGYREVIGIFAYDLRALDESKQEDRDERWR